MELYCPTTLPQLSTFFDFGFAPPLLFYSYIPIILTSLFFGFFIFFKDKFSLKSKILLFISISFSLWVVSILFTWVAVYARVVNFSWEFIAIPEVLIYLLTVYFVYVFVYEKDFSFKSKFLSTLFLLPVILLLSSKYNIDFFDIANCEGNIGYLWYYIYSFELASLVWILFLCFRKYKETKDFLKKRQIVLIATGTLFFLGIFFISNFAGELIKTYEINLIGPIGMVIFLATISYIIVKYKTIYTKMLGVQFLVSGLSVLVFAILFVRTIEIVRIVICFTLVLVLTLGMLLVRSVKKEIKQREEIEHLAEDLVKTNENLEHANTRLKELDRQKTEFVSFATHQLRSPLTAMKGYSSLILEGDYGEISTDLRDAVEKIHSSTNTLVAVVNDYLNISRIELGTMKYDFVSTDVKDLVKKIVGELQTNINKAGIKFSFECDERMKYMAKIDPDKFSQVIGNMIDNSIKYTPQGSITFSITKDITKNTILLASKDTGIGMTSEIIPKLFAKFSRAENASRVNIHGTGLGLFVAKQIVEAHSGKMWAESEGEGKGSQFYVEIPGEK